jgi:hypothetical protein
LEIAAKHEPYPWHDGQRDQCEAALEPPHHEEHRDQATSEVTSGSSVLDDFGDAAAIGGDAPYQSPTDLRA